MQRQRAHGRLLLTALFTLIALSLLSSNQHARASTKLAAKVRVAVANPASRYLRPGNSTSFPPLVSQTSTPGLVTGGGAVSTACIINPATNSCGGVSFTIANQGTWSYVSSTRVATFTALATANGPMTPITYRVVHSSPLDGTVTSTLTAIVDSTLTVPTLVNDYGTGLINSPVSKNVLTNDTVDSRTQLDPSSIKSCGSTNNNPATCTGTVYNTVQGTYSINFSNGTATFTPNSGYIGTPQPLRYIVRDMLGQLSSNIGSYYPTISSTTSSSSSTTAPTGNSTSTTITSGSGTTGTTVLNSGSNNGNDQVNTSGNVEGDSSTTSSPIPNSNKNDNKESKNSDPTKTTGIGSSGNSEKGGTGSNQTALEETERIRNLNFLYIVLSLALLAALFPASIAMHQKNVEEEIEILSDSKTKEWISNWFTKYFLILRKKEQGKSLFSTPDNFHWSEGFDPYSRSNNRIFRAVLNECRNLSRVRIFRTGLVRLAEIAYISPLTAVLIQLSALLIGPLLVVVQHDSQTGTLQKTSLICIGILSPLLGILTLAGWIVASTLKNPSLEDLSFILALLPGVFILPLAVRGLVGPRNGHKKMHHWVSVLASASICHAILYSLYFQDFHSFEYTIQKTVASVFNSGLPTSSGSNDPNIFIPVILTMMTALISAIIAAFFSTSEGEPLPISKEAKPEYAKRDITSALVPISASSKLSIRTRYVFSFALLAIFSSDFPIVSLTLAFSLFVGINLIINKRKSDRPGEGRHPVFRVFPVLLVGLLLRLSGLQFDHWTLLIILAIISSVPNLIQTKKIWA
jgi:hypothetical protein